jgi:hypothetical protein
LTYLVEIFLPLADRAGKEFPMEMFSQVMEELKHKFGGVTVYDRSPAKGKTVTSSDDISPGGPPAGRSSKRSLRKTKSLSALPASKGYNGPQVAWGGIDFLKETNHEC